MRRRKRIVERICLLTIVLAGAVVAAPAMTRAEGEHARRVGAELRVLIGDAKKLVAPGLTALHRQGLTDRIKGGLAGLALMTRLADQECGRSNAGASEAVGGLRRTFASGDIAIFIDKAQQLSQRYPLRAAGILPPLVSSARLARGRKIHSEQCAGCHESPDLAVARPAYDLFREAKSQSPQEFAARLILGIRGDRITGIDTPFPDEDLAGLLVFYRTQAPDSE